MSRFRLIAALALLYLPSQGSGSAPQPALAFRFVLLSVLPSAIAVDADGSAYVTGSLTYFFPTFPITPDAAQKTQADAFVAKIDPSGSRIVWATYLGGPHRAGHTRFSLPTNQPTGIAVDADHNVWISGNSSSPAFPTVNPVEPSGTSFLVKLNPQGSQVVFSTLLGNATASAVAVDAVGNAYIALSAIASRLPYETKSLNPAAAGGVAVAKFNPAGGVVYAARFGSSSGDTITDLAVDGTGAVHVIGKPLRSDFPAVNALVPRCVVPAGCSSFVAALDPSGSRLVFSTFLTGAATDARATSVAADSLGSTYVVGTTLGRDFIVQGAYQPAYGGDGDFFLTKLTPAGSLVYSTYLGGDRSETTPRVVVDAASRPAVIGQSISVNWGNNEDIQHADAPLYKSVDAGATWRRIAGTLRGSVFSLATTQSGNRVWYAGAADGVYRSIDQGETWQLASDSLGADRQVMELAVDPANANTVFAGTTGGTYRTRDAGQRWTKVDQGAFYSDYWPTALAIDGNGTVFTGTNGIRRTSDGGDTWIDASSGLRRGPTGAYGTVRQITFDPNRSGVIYAVSDAYGLYRSDNGGVSWTAQPVRVNDDRYGPLSTDATSIVVPFARPGRLVANSNAGVIRSDDDGGTWQMLGLTAASPSKIVGVRQQPDTVYVLDKSASRGFSLAVSREGGRGWQSLGAGTLSDSLRALLVDPLNPDVLLASGLVQSRPLVAGFDQSGLRIRYSGFIASRDSVKAVAQDPTGALYVLDSGSISKLRTP